jgi:ribosome-binding protein aMBF1 (putative translation factor)
MKKQYVARSITTGKTHYGNTQNKLAAKIGVHRSNIGRAASGEYERVKDFVVASA